MIGYLPGTQEPRVMISAVTSSQGCKMAIFPGSQRRVTVVGSEISRRGNPQGVHDPTEWGNDALVFITQQCASA